LGIQSIDLFAQSIGLALGFVYRRRLSPSSTDGRQRDDRTSYEEWDETPPDAARIAGDVGASLNVFPAEAVLGPPFWKFFFTIPFSWPQALTKPGRRPAPEPEKARAKAAISSPPKVRRRGYRLSYSRAR
jgi:hypothetical protein